MGVGTALDRSYRDGQAHQAAHQAQTMVMELCDENTRLKEELDRRDRMMQGATPGGAPLVQRQALTRSSTAAGVLQNPVRAAPPRSPQPASSPMSRSFSPAFRTD